MLLRLRDAAPGLFVLQQAQAALSPSAIAWGAQDVSEHSAGAYTGEVSAAMLKEFGVRYCIVGHSERRQYHGETDAVVAVKTQRALASGITPIVCVGETLAEREAGQTEAVLAKQFEGGIAGLTPEEFSQIVIAYEPVWAIGTGRTASVLQAQAAHAFIRGVIGAENAKIANSLRLLYGGSVKADNAASLFSCEDVDGGLIGGASLVAEIFAWRARSLASLFR